MRFSTLVSLAAWAAAALACDSCSEPGKPAEHKRLVRRMQPEALGALTKPKGPLEWGQINFLHTTDTHGWLEGHLKEQNYGADWGDYSSFVKHMRQKADRLRVDLLLIDCGDLHDGNGLSDSTSPNGVISNEIFSRVDYDLLSIGNHELYVTDVAYETFANFSKVYGERYVTSNVQIINKETGEYEYIGSKYRYFTTKHGLKVMAFGVLFDFTGNSNVSKVIKAADLVQESWFIDAVKTPKPVDLFIIFGHTPARTDDKFPTLRTLRQKIQELRPGVPIQAFGGHNHVRDFVVYDETSTALGSGRYCETLGWLSMTGINSRTFRGSMKPRGVPNPTRRAIKGNATTSTQPYQHPRKGLDLRYARRYLDWNRLTFAYHASKSQDRQFDTQKGLKITHDITDARKQLNTSTVLGCVPETYCMSCVPFEAKNNIYQLVIDMLAKVVVKEDRADKPRLLLLNTGGVRFDLVKGPFTKDDEYIVYPFKNQFQYLPDVPYSIAKELLDALNKGPYQRRSEEYSPMAPQLSTNEVCANPSPEFVQLKRREAPQPYRPITRRTIDSSMLYPGYVTSDDFGLDGDDTPHSKIPYFKVPIDIQANASFPTNGSMPTVVDLAFVDYIGAKYVIPALNKLGGKYSASDIQSYKDFGSSSFLREYALEFWQEGLPNCTTN
ncbi:TPA_exp: Secreted protein [Trichophyton benhamiae CBS 112371]|uniref:Secreted protein ARB_01864 n=1 Tax=Arthroderma benhamiae (strain ATCC MYA-4681 / CBS 112371) TaxID=663331 RepID=A1864_ARTBC|nr:Ser/Thr protein phosphatase family protein [Trichophyton benhamiae CBS 112371]D4B093.1 RecName: Full=Secreted protein ARB_01864; Flags: Precursor [Trichophyton benhamiae CBS 112371]EFE31245.1 Ser/Thr protein phosphatase family protein [Trichophyton benhamiae CBS 112371]DAA74420.1 TPA_exp: Secreted protein [Trichophyton benhamiae CBS 112371]